MAAAVVTSQTKPAVSSPRRIVSSRTVINSDPHSVPSAYPTPVMASSSKSSRSPPPPPPTNRSRIANPEGPSQPSLSESTPMSFKRFFRSPIEQTIRSATRSKGKTSGAVSSSPPCDDFATITAKEKNRGSQQSASVKVTEVTVREDGNNKERTGMFKRFETKVPLRRTRKVSATEPSATTPKPPLSFNHESEDSERRDNLPDKDQNRFRLPGFTSFVTPSLRLASLSSPTIHLSSHASISPSSPTSSSSPPSRPIISPPAPLTPKRPSVANANSPAPPSSSRPRKSRPAPLLPSSPSTPSLGYSAHSSSPAPTTPTRPVSREPVSLPSTPTPPSRNPQQQQQRQQLGKRSLGSTRRSSIDQPPPSPSSPTPPQRSPSSPRAQSPRSSRVVTPRGFTSASTSSLNYPPSYSPNAIRRSSVDRRSPSPALPRASTPSSPTRPRALSPTRQHQRAVSPSTVLTRHADASTSSISTPDPFNPMQREAVRVATVILCKEMLRPGQSTGLGIRESEEVEARMRALARLERVWGKSGASANGSATQVGATGSGNISGSASSAGEERERRLFTEALRDGYVLCQLMNKLRPGSIARVDPREDGKLRMANVTKFLASCSANGLPPEDLFLRDDLIEATSDSLARVAKTVITLVKWAETPVPTHSRLLRGGGKLKPINTSAAKPSLNGSGPVGSPYYTGSSSLAVMSSPNLPAHSPPHSPCSPTRANTRRWTPPSVGLPTLRPVSSDVISSSSDAGTAPGAETDGHETPTRTSDLDEVPPILPPRSPLRSRPSERSLLTSGAGESPLIPSFKRPTRVSIADSTTNQSIASSNLTDMSTYSSLLEPGIGNRRNSGAGGKFSTIRTVTTEATSLIPSEWPSLTRTEGSVAAASITACFDDTGGGESNGYSLSTGGGGTVVNRHRHSSLENAVRARERKPSESAVDLSRVVEESEEPTSGGGGGRGVARGKVAPANGRVERINLKQGKWPDDFLDALQSQNFVPSRPIAIKKSSRSSLSVSMSADASSTCLDEFGLADLSALSTSASVSSNPESQPSPIITRRPTHRARHSVDTPVLAPRDSLLPRDSSPDPGPLGSGLAPSGRVALRRNSTRAGIAGQRNGVYVPRRSSPVDSANGGETDPFVAIPFPRAASGEYVPLPTSLDAPSSSQSDSVERTPSNERGASTRSISGAGSGSAASDTASGSIHAPPPRGRFQSEVDGASSRRPRPNSYDEFGAKPRRSRFESMVNLGVASGENASASDLMARHVTAGSASRQTLVIREEGKSPTHFQLGNCIGRGQFGSVYRALNLNTGQMVAVKRIGLEGLKEEEIAQLMREVDLVKRLSHPSIVKYEGMARDENTLSIVLEYAENGSLGQTLKAFGKLNEKLVASYVVKILEGLDYLHCSDVVHCDLKAANILTTKTGNVKLSDFGVSLNLRAVEQIKDVAGTPNWMAPEVIELKGASTKSDIWSLGCTVIELLTGRPPYGDIANAMTVMFRIVEDDSPPIPEHFSEPLVAFLKECFHKDPAKRPSAEELFEHEWLKNHWGLNKDLRPQDSIPFLRRVSADLQKNDAARNLIANLDLLDSPVPENTRAGTDDVILSSSPGHRSFTNASPVIPEVPPADTDLFDMREHTFVKTTFSKPVSCRVCIEPVKKGAVLCSHCSLIAHSKCAGRAPPTCDLRSKLLMHAQFAKRGSPADIFTRLPTPASDGLGASSSRGSLDRERTSSPQLSASSPPHPPVAYKVLAPFKRSHTSLSQDPTQSNSSICLAGATPPPVSQRPQKSQQWHQPRKSILPEGRVIRQKLSIILMRQRDPSLLTDRPRPQSMISSIGSSSPHSPQSNSLRSMQTAAESISSRAARVDASISTATESSTDAAAVPRRVSVHSGTSTIPDGVGEPSSSAPPASSASASAPTTKVPATVVGAQDTHRTRRGRGESKSSGNCAIQ